MFKSFANLGSMLKQAQEMGGKVKAVNERLKGMRATASAGGGLVEVEVNGLGDVLRISIDPQLIQRGDREMLEDLLPGAVNQALAKAKELHLEAMASMTEGLDMGALQDAMSRLMGDGK